MANSGAGMGFAGHGLGADGVQEDPVFQLGDIVEGCRKIKNFNFKNYQNRIEIPEFCSKLHQFWSKFVPIWIFSSMYRNIIFSYQVVIAWTTASWTAWLEPWWAFKMEIGFKKNVIQNHQNRLRNSINLREIRSNFSCSSYFNPNFNQISKLSSVPKLKKKIIIKCFRCKSILDPTDNVRYYQINWNIPMLILQLVNQIGRRSWQGAVTTVCQIGSIAACMAPPPPPRKVIFIFERIFKNIFSKPSKSHQFPPFYFFP